MAKENAAGRSESTERCGCCALVCAVCRIAVFSCCRRMCSCCAGRNAEDKNKPEFSVLCVGSQGAGKSTILASLASEDTTDIQPTLGFAFKMVQTSKATLEIQELGGSDKIRPYWDRYYSGHDAIIYVIDSSQGEVTVEEQCRLEQCLGATELRGLPLLVLCNKQDMPNALSAAKVCEKLCLESSARGRSHFTLGSSALADPSSVRIAVDTLVEALLTQRLDISL